jgi:glyoxylase-like metal-dependent hydrolase (beta-lactamase superfamily II)
MKTVKTLLMATILTTNFAIAQQSAIYEFESDGNGFNTKTIFYDNGKEVVAFDAQFMESYAQQAINFLKTKTKSPIKWLVVTHPNPDKFNGIPAFQRIGAKVIMSSASARNLQGVHDYKKYYFVKIAKAFTDENYPKLPKADVTFEKTYEIKLSDGKKIELTEINQKGISTNQTIAYIPTIKAVIVGDLVHHKAHAWLEGPIENGKPDYNTENWVKALQSVLAKYPKGATIYGGRGKTTSVENGVNEQIDYLKKAETITRNYINSLEGKTIDEKKAKVDYKQLTKLFETAFPDYSLSYMIEYGAYGLVMSIK